MFATGNIVLGGVSLNNSLQWTDRYAYTPAAQSVQRTLQGGLIVFSQSLSEGRPITLVASPDTGWFTYTMVEAIMALALDPSISHSFTFYGETYNVRFRYEEPPPFEFLPLQPRDPRDWVQEEEPAPGYFTGTVKLFTV